MYNQEREQFGKNYAHAINQCKDLIQEQKKLSNYVEYLDKNGLKDQHESEYNKSIERINAISKKINDVKKYYTELDQLLGVDTFKEFQTLVTKHPALVRGGECECIFDKYNNLIEEKIEKSKEDFNMNMENKNHVERLNELDMACDILEDLFEVELPAMSLIQEEKKKIERDINSKNMSK